MAALSFMNLFSSCTHNRPIDLEFDTGRLGDFNAAPFFFAINAVMTKQDWKACRIVGVEPCCRCDSLCEGVREEEHIEYT